MCVRGLKPLIYLINNLFSTVARHVRAWIETRTKREKLQSVNVARHVRAWIET